MVDIEQVLYVEQNVLVAEFPEEMEISDEMFERVNERFAELAARSNVDTHISALQMDASLNGEMFARAQEAAESGKQFGITTWIIVSEGIKNMALRSKVGEIEGVDIETVETKAEAMELAAE